MNKTHIYRFAAAPEAVCEVMKNPDFHLEVDRMRDDIASNTMRDINERGQVKEFTLVVQEYERTKTGKINRGSTTEGRTLFTWDDRARTLKWVYTPGQEAKRVDVRGLYRVQPDGSGCKLVHDYTIDIKIPIIGRGIAKIVDREFVKAFPRFEATTNKYLKNQ